MNKFKRLFGSMRKQLTFCELEEVNQLRRGPSEQFMLQDLQHPLAHVFLALMANRKPDLLSSF